MAVTRCQVCNVTLLQGGIDLFIIIETFPPLAGVMLEWAEVISEERVQSMINYQYLTSNSQDLKFLEPCFCLRTERRRNIGKSRLHVEWL